MFTSAYTTAHSCGMYRYLLLDRIQMHNCWILWRRHHMETLSTLLALCARTSSVNDEFPSQRPVTRSFDVFFDLRLNKWYAGHLRSHRDHYDVSVMSTKKIGFGAITEQWQRTQSRRRSFETSSRPLWRHCNSHKILVIMWNPNPNSLLSDGSPQCTLFFS